MFILIFFLTLSITQFVLNKVINISDENTAAYAFSKKDSLIIAGIFLLGIILQIFNKILPFYWIIVATYFGISLISILVVLQMRKEGIVAQREQVQQIYEILQKLVDKKGEGLDFNNVPFTLYYKYGNVQQIRVMVEPTQFSSDPEKAIMPFIPQLNAFLPTYDWLYELHLEQRYIDFIGNDKPPTMARWPGSWLRPLRAFPVGVSGKGELCWTPDDINKDESGRSLYLDENNNPIPIDLSLAKAPQGLVAGGTGGGKSVFVQNLIMHAISHHDEIALACIDPKVVEFSAYKGMNGIVGVANNIRETAEMLRIGRAVMYKRNKELSELGIKNVMEHTPHEYSGKIFVCGREMEDTTALKIRYRGEEKNMSAKELSEFLEDMKEIEVCLNGADWIPANKNCIHKLYSDRMPMLLFIVDEMAELTMKSGLKTTEAKEEDALKDEIVSIISSIAQLGRSAGVHVLVATQKPNATVVPTILRSNLILRVFMGTAAEAGASLVTLDNTLATTTEGKPPGMGIMQVNAQPIRFRCYFSKFQDLHDYYKKRGMNEFGYGPESIENDENLPELGGTEELNLTEERITFEFEDERVDIDKKENQIFEEI